MKTMGKYKDPEYQKKYYIKNKDKWKIYWQSRRFSRERAEYIKQYQKDNLKEISAKRKLRAKTDINYKLATNLRSRINTAIKGEYKSGSAVRDLGCSIEEFKIYIESKFKPGMTWDNWSRTGWHLDHIKPLIQFDLSNPEEFKKASHYTNIQPLWAEENHRKNKYEADSSNNK